MFGGQKSGNVETVICDTTECSSSQICKGDTQFQQMFTKHHEESNTAFLFQKRFEEMDSKFNIRDAQLHRATDDSGLGGAQIKLENENATEFEHETKNAFTDNDPEYDLVSVKVEEEKVEFHLAESYSCMECNLNYDGLASYKTHREINHGDLSENASIANDEELKCNTELNEPGTSFGSFMESSTSRETKDSAMSKSFKIRTSTQINLKTIKCDVCDGRFTKGSLKKHMKTHTGEKPFKCDVCDGRFSQKAHLKVHVLIHTGEKPYTCDLCDSVFKRKSFLKQHVITHSGEKPFKCDVCAKEFGRKTSLQYHLMTHTEEKPFKCEICDYRSIKKWGLKQHVMTHTGNKPFKCDVCDSRFTRKSVLKQHVITHLEEKPFKCDVCHNEFNQKSHLKKHTSTWHIGKTVQV